MLSITRKMKYLKRLHVLNLGGCSKSILLSGDGYQKSSLYEQQFGIFNFLRYDENYNIVYEHEGNNKYTLEKGTLTDEAQGWMVRKSSLT